MRYRATVLLLSALVMAGASGCPRGVRPDPFMSALEAGDRTALIEGCGNQLVPGYTYCRITEGTVADQNLWFVGPPAECDGDAPCVTFKVFYPNGEPSLSGSIPRGQTRVGIPWRELLKRETFAVGDRGFWPYVYRIRWIGPEKREFETVSEGEIRLRVLPGIYVPLNDQPEDPAFAWSWIEDGVQVRMTTGGRTFVGKRP